MACIVRRCVTGTHRRVVSARRLPIRGGPFDILTGWISRTTFARRNPDGACAGLDTQ